MRVLLIGNRETNSDSETYFKSYVEFFNRATAHNDEPTTTEYTMFHDLYIAVGDDTFEVYDTRHGRHLSDYQVVFLRGGGYRKCYDVIKAISVYANLHGIRAVNDYSAFRESSKLTQAVQFYTEQMPVAQTVYANEAALSGKHPLAFDFPCILKATFGSHGGDNYLVKSLDEAATIAQADDRKTFVLQRYVPNDRDYRILIIGEEIAVIERTAAGDSHLNNTSQGAQARLVSTDSLPAEIVEASRHIAQVLQLSIAGVDVLADKTTGNFYFLEVNAQPQLMTGAFLSVKSEMIGRFLQKLASDQLAA
ncbi:MAG TPA: hypothetical protein VLF69_04620 [Candidatus Saccharimonadales bacterium]|nr:hypothetical protein [Candidatus Saccharimonadales bacterium]